MWYTRIEVSASCDGESSSQTKRKVPFNVPPYWFPKVRRSASISATHASAGCEVRGASLVYSFRTVLQESLFSLHSIPLRY